MTSSDLSFNILEFKTDVLEELIADYRRIKLSNNYLSEKEAQELVGNLIKWLSSTPKNVVFRINTILCDQHVAHERIKDALNQYHRSLPIILMFPHVMELIIVHSWDSTNELTLTRKTSEVIVDAACGAAVLRGAHVYAPGVLGMPHGLNFGDTVSVFADLKQACKRGLIKQYNDESKLFLGNGVVKLTREKLFNYDSKDISGIAIHMTDVASYIPQLNDSILPKGHILLQNLPSVLCSRILDPQPEETILDMCAAPGNKTTHIASLMKNKGTVIALEKIKSKLERLNANINNFSTSIVRAFCFDSTKAVSETEEKPLTDGPPFSIEKFDRVLLDGPCSALGQRPQIRNPISVSQLKSYVPLQRKLFTTAVKLLKTGGTLVYSTCTITVAENEGIIAWALKTFPNLELQSVQEKLKYFGMDRYASVGYNIDGLTIEQSNKLCRFDSEHDTVGFFIACFIKR